MMNSVIGTVRRFLVEQAGATATEYAIILGILIVAVIGAAAMFGIQFSNTTSAVTSGLSNGTETSGSFGAAFRPQTTVSAP